VGLTQEQMRRAVGAILVFTGSSLLRAGRPAVMKAAGTPATAFLAEHGAEFTEHFYEYVEHGGTGVSSNALGVPEHEVVKTLIMETDKGDPLVVLMHGDRKVSTKELARVAGVKRIFPSRPETAQRHSGLSRRRHLALRHAQGDARVSRALVLQLPRIYINGGRRGYLLGMASSELVRVLSPILVDVALVE
jgi:Cys-tRNA(Pro) deacylase